jgi:DNA-binding transcriptional regulator YdaS (Cro superfamily)
MSKSLKLLLAERGLKLVDLARKVGVDKSVATRWAQRRVPAERVMQVEEVTGISRHSIRPDLFGPAPVSEGAAS